MPGPRYDANAWEDWEHAEKRGGERPFTEPSGPVLGTVLRGSRVKQGNGLLNRTRAKDYIVVTPSAYEVRVRHFCGSKRDRWGGERLERGRQGRNRAVTEEVGG